MSSQPRRVVYADGTVSCVAGPALCFTGFFGLASFFLLPLSPPPHGQQEQQNQHHQPADQSQAHDPLPRAPTADRSQAPKLQSHGPPDGHDTT